MKGKVIIMMMTGVVLLMCWSTVALAQQTGGLPACQNSLSICTTNLTSAQTNLATCQETLTQCIQKTAFPSWDKKLPCDSTSNCPRFEVLADWNNEAVLDKETGLVWEQSPSTSQFEWQNAQAHCLEMTKGNRKGWRLPTVQELSSLSDPTLSDPSLPSGHPFSNVQLSLSFYWSATTAANETSYAFDVSFVAGSVGIAPKVYNTYAWCVRGGQGVDAQ